MQVTMQSYMLVAIQYSQAAALCTQAEQYSVGSIHRRLSKYNEHVHNLGVCQSKHVINNIILLHQMMIVHHPYTGHHWVALHDKSGSK